VSRTQIDQARERTVTVRPAVPADVDALADFFSGLSVRSRYLRFFAAITPSHALLRRMSCSADGLDVLVALTGGAIVGHAMAADETKPTGQRKTDIGVVVADSWQGQGVGAALVRALIARAQARGVESITMDVLPGNHQVLAMIASHWAAARTDCAADYFTVHVPLPQREQLHHDRRPVRSSSHRHAGPGPHASTRGRRLRGSPALAPAPPSV
jgi:ribosomal protein S18 acetylase RimI-like enzyme